MRHPSVQEIEDSLVKQYPVSREIAREMAQRYLADQGVAGPAAAPARANGVTLGPRSPLRQRSSAVAQGAVAKRAGRSFEEEMQATVDAYAALGLAKFCRAHPPVVGPPNRLRYAGPGQVDFVGHVGGVPVAFDTKSDEGCASYRYYERDMHELDFLLGWRKAGGVAFILLLDRARETLYLLDDIAALRAGESITLRSPVRAKSGAQPLVPALVRTESERTLDAALSRPIWPWIELAQRAEARLADVIIRPIQP